MPTVGSLFAGIGGLDLGLERAGWAVRWQIERDVFCRRVLARRWPDVARHGDIEAIDPKRLEPVDLICGGFPCQPASLAGKRDGQSDVRWLWPEAARIVRVLRPRLLLLENVPGLLSVGAGRAMGEILGDLAACGYDAEWDCIPAAAVGAPHLRDRVWLVAHAGRGRLAERARPPAGESGQRPSERGEPRRAGSPLADAEELALGPGLRAGAARGIGRGRPSDGGGADALADADRAGLEVWSGAEGLRQFAAVVGGGQWAVEPDVGRVADGVPARVDRLRALGNAVVPQLAEWIGRRLLGGLT
jgi:DNA (cytosine-5)-methyltransferase 1